MAANHEHSTKDQEPSEAASRHPVQELIASSLQPSPESNAQIPEFTLSSSTADDFFSPSSFSGEWQTRFDPSVTSKGAFYLDNHNAVSVDMMKSAHYPLRLLDDPQLEAQVHVWPRPLTANQAAEGKAFGITERNTRGSCRRSYSV